MNYIQKFFFPNTRNIVLIMWKMRNTLDTAQVENYNKTLKKHKENYTKTKCYNNSKKKTEMLNSDQSLEAETISFKDRSGAFDLYFEWKLLHK